MNRAIQRSGVNIDMSRIGVAILNKISAILLHCEPTLFCLLLAADILAILGPHDSGNRAIREERFYDAKW